MTIEPKWLQVARAYLGQAEVPGKASNPWIVNLWLRLGGSWLWQKLGADDSASPWCGTFVAACLTEVGLSKPAHWYRARAYLDYGVVIPEPVYGCIVVYERKGGGHVGFAVGRDEHGNIMTLGGNQSDRVSIAAFDSRRVLGYAWPPGAPYAHQPLPRYVGNFPTSHNEA